MTQRMTNFVGVDSIYDCVLSNKLQGGVWIGPITDGLGIEMWPRGNEFLGGKAQHGCFSVWPSYLVTKIVVGLLYSLLVSMVFEAQISISYRPPSEVDISFL